MGPARSAAATRRALKQAPGTRRSPRHARAAAIALAEANLPGVIVNPRQTRAFAHAGGQLAKTDRLDALTAGMRRLLVILNAMTKHHEVWNPT